jgi:hypothetical protein
MERRLEWGRGQGLLVVALLPALLCASPLGGASAWLHAHGEVESHVHVVTAEVDPADPGALHEWHELRHTLGHEEGRHGHERGEEPASAPAGIRIDFPHVLAAAPRGPSPAFVASVGALAVHLAPRWCLDVVENVHRPDLCRSAWPPQRAERSGIVELLRASHALRI